MSVLVNNDSKVIIQGLQSTEGTFHEQMIEYGTNIVGKLPLEREVKNI